MADSMKDKLENVGHTISEKASEVGHKVAEGVEKATDWAKEKMHQAGHKVDEMKQKAGNQAQETFGSSGGNASANIKEHMDVISSCGCTMGKVDHVQGNQIKLTKNDSPDGQHHLIPMSWVSRVDTHVHLNKNSDDVKSQWQPA